MRQVECRMRNSNGTMVTLHGRRELRCTDTRPDAWQPCGDENCDYHGGHRMKSLQIARDSSEYVQTKRRGKVELTVGGVNTIIPGTTITIRCPIRNARPSEIIWLKRGKSMIPDIGRVRKTKKGILKIHRARPTDAGMFICKSDSIEANVTISFHSASEGESLFASRKRYLNRRGELMRTTSSQENGAHTDQNGYVLSDAVDKSTSNVSVTPYDFVAGEWTTCSRTCEGSGFMKRSVTCEVIMEEFYRIVEDRLCIEHGLVKPPSRKACGGGECPRWSVKGWNRKVCAHISS